MRTLRSRLLLLAAGSLVALGCAHGHSGPVVPRPPTVTVSLLEPVLTNPQEMRFRSAVLLHNNMDAPIAFDRVDYQVRLCDRPLINQSFSELEDAEENGDETVTLPFQIALGTLSALAPSMLVDGNFRVSLEGTVYPAAATGLAPVSFERTLALPIPRLPQVKYLGSEGMPLGPSFTVRLSLQNPNGFPVTVETIDSHVDIGNDRYRLVHSAQEPALGPGQSQVLTLVMHNSPLKMASMFGSVISAAGNKDTHYRLGGSIRVLSPYGVLYLPVSFSSN